MAKKDTPCCCNCGEILIDLESCDECGASQITEPMSMNKRTKGKNIPPAAVAPVFGKPTHPVPGAQTPPPPPKGPDSAKEEPSGASGETGPLEGGCDFDRSEFQIEDDVKIPDQLVGRVSRYAPVPLDQLKPGQSIFVPMRSEKSAQHHRQALLSHAQKRLKEWKFTTRAEEKDGVQGARIWRTA